ncbi:major facilitator superfamily domain-containing protein [Aspergillus flavus]|nr:major facilitator superfamily domain-containing protein [Aspergillus flavus]
MMNNASSSEKHPETAGPANIIPLIPPTDPDLVTLDGPDDPHNPKNWSARKKWLAFVPMSMFNLLSSMSSATVAPALSAIGEDLGFPSKTLLILSLSVFFLGTAIVPLFTAPVSEMIGSVPVLLTMNVAYIVFNTACGAAKSPTQLIIFRFLAGLGAAGPYGIGSGMNSDLFEAHDRGKAIAVFTLAPLIGTAIGPITGGFVPIIQVLSLYLAYLNGILYLMVATFHDVWTGIYQESVSIGSLNYLSMTVGLAIATQFGVRFADKIYQHLRAKNNGQGKAGFRLPMLCAIAVVVPIGLFWYGWRKNKYPLDRAVCISSPNVIQNLE